MKRNLELIRHILLTMESSSKTRICIEDFETTEYDPKTISYHINLLLDCDYLDATVVPMCGCPYDQFIVHRLTSQGHDYLDSVRDDNIWEETKKQIGTAFDVFLNAFNCITIIIGIMTIADTIMIGR